MSNVDGPTMPARLDEALRTLQVLPEKLPLALPLSHLTAARTFKAVAHDGSLAPTHCRIFGEDILYLFYGGIFYRTSDLPTTNALEWPVGFLFNPVVLTAVDRYYPADTGLLASARLPENTKIQEFGSRFAVEGRGDYSVPCKMVYHIFGTNEFYLSGAPNQSCESLPYPFPELFEFFRKDLSSFGVDQRYRRFEAHYKTKLSLGHLIWIGFPRGYEREFATLCKATAPFIPEYEIYEAYPNARPTELAAILQDRAHKVVKRFIDLPEPK